MKTVLITDDESALLELYDAEFRRAGYAVRTALSAQEALKIVDGEPVDCVVMDIRLPGENGLDAISELRRRNREMPIVLNSAYGSHKSDFHSWLADAYVVKSPDFAELIRTVDQILGKTDAP